MECYDQVRARRSKRKMFDIRPSDLDSKKLDLKRLKREPELDSSFIWFIEFLLGSDEPTEVIRREDQNEYENENENVNENENENETEYEDQDVDEKDKDPQYCMFLENLTEHGKSYKLKISEKDEEPRFLCYEEPDNSNWCDELQSCIDELTISEDSQINQKAKRRLSEKTKHISTKKEVSRTKRNDDHKSVTQPSELVAVKLEENNVDFEKNATGSDSDSDVVILDNVRRCGKVDDKQPILAEKEPALREKLMQILKQPYNEKEYEELSDDIEQKKPMGRHLDLRGRPLSSAFGGVEKSLLDNIPGSFRRMLSAAQNDPPKALNLLRMFYFWLEHVPNEDAFEPWKDKQILKVRPSK